MPNQDLQYNYNILSEISSYAAEVSLAETIHDLYNKGLKKVLQILKCKTSFIYLLTKDDKYELKYIQGKDRNFPLNKFYFKDELLMNHKTAKYFELTNESEAGMLKKNRTNSIHIITAPLKAEEWNFGVFGVIIDCVDHNDLKLKFTEIDKFFFQEIVNLTSILATSKKKIGITNFILQTFDEVRKKKHKKEIFKCLADRLTCETTKFTGCIIHLYDELKNDLYGFVSSGIEYKLEGSSRTPIGKNTIGIVFNSGEMRITKTTEEDFLYGNWAFKNGYKSMISVQLKDMNGNKYGVLSLFTKYLYIEGEDDKLFINNFLNQTSMVIDGILHEERIKKLSYIDSIISQIIPFDKSKEEILNILLKTTLTHLNGQIGYISLFSKKSEKIEPTYKLDITGNLINFKVPDSLSLNRENSISGWVVNNKKGYLYPSNDDIDELFVPYGNLGNLEIKSELVVPFIYQDKVIGLIVLSSTLKHAFDSTDLEFLEKTAKKAAQVMQSKIFYNASRALTNEIYEYLDEEKICKSAAEITTNALEISVCCVWLITSEKGIEYLSLQGWNGCKIEDPNNFKMPKHEGGISWDTITKVRNGNDDYFFGTYHDVDRVESGFRHINFAKQNGLKSMRCTPIIHNKQVIGVINAYTNRIYDFFETERVLLKSIANRTASALYNAKWEKHHIMSNPGIIALAFVHDITHQMHYLTSSIELLKDFLPEKVKSKDFIKDTIESLEKYMGSLRKSFDSLARIGKRAKATKKIVSLSLILDDVEHLFKSTFEHKNIKFSYRIIEHNNISVNCFANEIEQVLDNLMLNSIFALNKIPGRKKEIKIELSTIFLKNQEWAKIVVYDNGIGIKEENMEYIYNADFSTKGDEGTGLGLSICKRIIENNHQGRMYHESKEGEWTRFYILLPMTLNK